MAVRERVALAVVLVLSLGAGTAWWWQRSLHPDPPAGSHAGGELTAESPGPRLEGAGTKDRGDGAPDAALRVTGTVVASTTGEPVAGARVLAHDADVDEIVADPTVLGEARTDAVGRFVLRLADESPACALVADAPGHSPRAAFARPGDDVTTALDPPRTITGFVRDIEDAPIAGATVRWLGVLGAAPVGAVARTRADGSYTLVAPRVRGMDLATVLDVSAPGYAPVRLPLSRAAGSTGDAVVDVLLLRGATLTGQVVDAEDRRPLPGARVFVWSETEVTGIERLDGRSLMNPHYTRRLGTARTDASGRFRVDHVPAWSGQPLGIHTLSRWRRRLGYVAAVADGHVAASREILVPDDGQVLDVVLALPRAGSVQGLVTDEEGAPIAGARVGWGWKDGTRRAWIPSAFEDAPRTGAVTDAKGHYRLERVAAPHDASGMAIGARRAQSVRWEERREVEVVPVAGRPVTAPDLVLPEALPADPPRAGSSPASTPLLGPLPEAEPSRVVLEGSLRDADSGRPILKHRIELSGHGDLVHTARFAGPGRFAFLDVPDGVYTLRVVAPGYDGVTRDVRISEERPSAPLDLRLTGGITAQVCCRTADGAPLAGGNAFFRGAGTYITGDLDASGCAPLRGLRPGRSYDVTCARAPSGSAPQWFCPVPYEPIVVPDEPGPVRLDVTLARAGVANLRVVGEHDQEARAGTSAWLSDAAGRRIWERDGLRGSGWSVIAPQGRYVLHVAIPGADPVQKDLELDPDPSTVVVVNVP